MAKQSLAHPLPILLTRPEAQGEGFASRLVDRFKSQVQPVLSPLMAPVFLKPQIPAGDFGAVIFTSSTGIAAALALKRPLPHRAFCVGRKTAEVAAAAGFDATSTDGDAETLLANLVANPLSGHLMHLRGQEARGDLADRLTKAGIPTEEVVVYRQDPQPLTANAIALLHAQGPVILPLFSPRSAVLFGKAMPDDARAQLFLAALSPAVAQSAAFRHATLVVAARPDADAMLDAVATLIVAASLP